MAEPVNLACPQFFGRRPRRSLAINIMLHAVIVSVTAVNRPSQCTRRSALIALGASLATHGCRRPAFAAEIDPDYPGTAVERMLAARQRASSLTLRDLSGDWESTVRPRVLWAAGLRDLRDAATGQGYTGHAFNDAIHVDATTMRAEDAENINDGRVRGIAVGNRLGPGIVIASLPELGSGGSWSTCANGCQLSPPQDVAHVQFRSRIAFKLVWVPDDDYRRFVLVDDDGRPLATGAPTGRLPALEQRQANYAMVAGSKYGSAAAQMARTSMSV